jgi:hypothetical protein
MKRRPPEHNVRRVRAIQGNIRYTLVNKCQHTIHCESFQEYKLALLLERNPSVAGYMSQPELLHFYNEKERPATSTYPAKPKKTAETVGTFFAVTVQKPRQYSC